MTTALAFAVAALLGALLPPLVYRFSVPAETPVRVACDHCGQLVRLRPACPTCRTRWGPPWWSTAAVAGVAAGLLVWAIGPEPVLPLFVALAVYGTGLGAIDLACRRLPTILVLPALGVSALLMLGLAAFTGDWNDLRRAVLGAIVLGFVFELLYLIPGGNLGYGDVRLAVLLGLFLGWLGWREVLWGALLPWLINGPVVLGLLLAGKVGWKSRLPLGPALLAGALLSVVLGGVLDSMIN